MEKKKLTSRTFREPDSLNDGLHLKFIWKKIKKKKKILFSTILFRIYPYLNPNNETYSSSSKPQTAVFFPQKTCSDLEIPNWAQYFYRGKKKFWNLKKCIWEQNKNQKHHLPLHLYIWVYYWLVWSMIKIIPDQASFHHNQPHIPGKNCWRHQQDATVSTQNLCLMGKIKLHQQPENDPIALIVIKVLIRKKNMSGKKTFLHYMVKTSFCLNFKPNQSS